MAYKKLDEMNPNWREVELPFTPESLRKEPKYAHMTDKELLVVIEDIRSLSLMFLESYFSSQDEAKG